jgi:hypothetical protein
VTRAAVSPPSPTRARDANPPGTPGTPGTARADKENSRASEGQPRDTTNLSTTAATRSAAWEQRGGALVVRLGLVMDPWGGAAA